MSFLIRVNLPDTPGSLGNLAFAFGEVGANIQSVDIVENAPDGTVTDDIVVDLPKGVLADSLLTAAQSVPGVEVDSFRPFSGRVDRRGQIELLARVAHAPNLTAAMQEVADSIPQALTSTWAIILNTKGTIHRVAGSDAAPTDDGSTPEELSLEVARIIQPDREAWVPPTWALLDSALAAAPLGETGLIIVIGRVGGPDYLASEVAHLGNLGTILGAFLN